MALLVDVLSFVEGLQPRPAAHVCRLPRTSEPARDCSGLLPPYAESFSGAPGGWEIIEWLATIIL